MNITLHHDGITKSLSQHTGTNKKTHTGVIVTISMVVTYQVSFNMIWHIIIQSVWYIKPGEHNLTHLNIT